MPFNINTSPKDYYTTINCPDLEDQLSQDYIPGPDFPNPPPRNYDPGRIRYEPFFKKMYGATLSEVRSNLVPIKWLPGGTNRTLWVTRVNGVAVKLRAISDELDQLPPELKRFVDPCSGVFTWRKIRDSSRYSMHSFGIAIDIQASLCHYWCWNYPQAGEDDDTVLKYRNTVPWEIVSIFEKYGFIWGGKWYHYDTMHFEYRPELLPVTARKQTSRHDYWP